MKRYRVTGMLSAVFIFAGAVLADSGAPDLLIGAVSFGGAVLAIVSWEMYCAAKRRQAQQRLNERLRDVA